MIQEEWMRIRRPRKGVLGLAITTLSGLTAGFVFILVWAATADGVAADPALAVVWHARTRSYLEVGVVVFQCAGVASLLLSRLLPKTPWADRGRAAFLTSLVGLGALGILCAGYASDFALFAGAGMAILLHVVILGEGHHAPHSASRKLRTSDGFTTV
jgi:hypothetical protein